MFDMDGCYKIMFESMFEQCELKEITEKICLHIHASVCYVLNSGRIAAYACAKELIGSHTEQIMKKGYISLSEYDHFKEEKKNEERCMCLERENIFLVKSDLFVNGEMIGYCVIIFRDASMKEQYQLVCEMLRQMSSEYRLEEDVEVFGNVPMRKLIDLQMIFREGQEELEQSGKEAQKDFVEVLFPDIRESQEKAKIFQKVQNIWNVSGILVAEDSVAVVFCAVTKNSMETILNRLEILDEFCCVSAMFETLYMCRRKKSLLEQMSVLKNLSNDRKIMEEKENYAALVYTQALPILKETGIKDYSVERLLKEDQTNHTELFDTLKTYLLCENSIKETAKVLHIHRNTLVYRLKQIREIMQKDINDNKISRELLSYMMLFDIARQTEVE